MAVLDFNKEANSPGITLVGEGIITYTLSYENKGNIAATDVVIVETVPSYTTMDAAASDSGWNCTGTTAGSTCQYTIAALQPGEAGEILFVAQIDLLSIDSSVLVIENSATIVGLLHPDDTVKGSGAADANVRVERPTALDTSAEPTYLMPAIHLPLIVANP